jgi:hypothetical protein
MSESRTPFDHRPDPIVGAALRDALSAPGDAAFVARVMAAAAQPLARSPVDVLAGWARPGIAAAALAAMAAGYIVGLGLSTPRESLEEAMVTALSPTPATAALAKSNEPPDGSVAFATFIEP